MVALSLAALFGWLGSGVAASEPPVWERTARYGAVSIWGLKGFLAPGSVQERVSAELPQVLSSPWIAGRAPERWSILLEGDAGAAEAASLSRWRPGMADPEGHPAILVSAGDFLNPSLTRGLVAHELGHLIHSGYRPGEESWLREGMAMWIESRATGRPPSCLRASLETPETPLMASLDPDLPGYGERPAEEICAQYGHVYQFVAYLHRLCGGDALVEELLSSGSPLSGARFVDSVLSRRAPERPLCAGFKPAFRAFELARFARDASDPERFTVLSFEPVAIRDTRSKSLPPYSAQAYVPPKSAKGCTKGDVRLGAAACVRIRLE